MHVYPSVPQQHLNNRKIMHNIGVLLSGSSAVNAGQWQRGASQDYDLIAELAGDDPVAL